MERKSPKHPPIPPECPYFIEDRNGVVYFVIWCDEGGNAWHGKRLEALSPFERGLAAGIGRAGWTDETWEHPDAESEKISSKMAKAAQNAVQWKLWGMGLETWDK